MEMAQVGVRTRARAALAMGAPSSSPARSPKRRKINNNNTSQGLKFSASSFVQLKTMSSGAVVVKPETVSPLPAAEEEERCSSAFSDESSPASCCSSNGSFGLDEERIKLLDLEVESAQVETSTCNCRDDIRREMKMSLSSELRTNSQEVESAEKKPTQANSRCVVVSTPQKMPTKLELEEFFADAEIDIQKRFSDKYNYDIVRDVPMEGRYEWVQLKP